MKNSDFHSGGVENKFPIIVVFNIVVDGDETTRDICNAHMKTRSATALSKRVK